VAKRSGLDGRQRMKRGEIHKKSGRTLVRTLRREYGEHFAAGHRSDMMLETLLRKTHSPSLHDYLRHH
jgi:hypothetical protein